MKEEKVTQVLLATVARIFMKDTSELSRETRIIEDLQAKSVNIVEIIAVLQNELGVEIPMAKLRRQKTIGAVIDYVVGLST